MSKSRIFPLAFRLAINKEYLKTQYAGMVNYQNRKTDALLEWYAEQYKDKFDLRNVDRILEAGCGDGTFWKYFIGGKPFKPKVVMTDLVEKMLTDCRENMSSLEIDAEYRTADIDALPFGPESFSAVLAHKVIYHAENPEKAIAGFHHVLKPNGFLGLAVLNQGVYGPIWKLAHSINHDIPDQSLTSRFDNTDADKILPHYFSEITTRNYVSTKEFSDSNAVVKYVETNPIAQPLMLSNNFFALFGKKVSDVIKKTGPLICQYNSTLYLCQKIR